MGSPGVDSMMIVEDCPQDPGAGIDESAPHAQDPPAQHDIVCGAGA